MVRKAPLPSAKGNGATNATGTTTIAPRKRAAKSSAKRANVNRIAKKKTGKKGGVRKGKGNTNSKISQTKLSYEETIQLMGRNNRPNEELSAKDLEELEELEGLAGCSTGKEDTPTQLQDDYIQQVANTKVPMYGTLQVEKNHDDAIRLFSANMNSMSFWLRDNYKAERLKHVLQQYGVDSAGIQEVCINWSAFKSSQTMASLLRYGAQPIRSVASHNKREDSKSVGRSQRGGTVTIINEQLCSYVKDSGVDHTGLGRWSWYLLEGEPGYKTRVITAYAPCGDKTSDIATVYKQQWRYIQEKGLKTNPKSMFREDLLHAPRQWKQEGDRLILMMDANENVQTGFMCKQMGEEDIDMVEAVHDQVPGPGPKTWFRGKESIDGIWVSRALEIIGASYLPFHADLGDHRPVMLDLTVRSVLGGKLQKLTPPAARRLNSKVKRVRVAYIARLEKLFKGNNIYERLLEIDKHAEYPLSDEAAKALEAIDRLVTSLMLQAEKGCQKLQANHYKFSPQVKTWLDRCHAYR